MRSRSFFWDTSKGPPSARELCRTARASSSRGGETLSNGAVPQGGATIFWIAWLLLGGPGNLSATRGAPLVFIG